MIEPTEGDLVDPLLARLGVQRGAPSIEYLRELQQAFLAQVSYETLWLQQGLVWAIDPEASIARVATTGRAGYCYHLNGAFLSLLRNLGFAVEMRAGAVHRDPSPVAEAFGNHLVLHVSGLATDSNPAGSWYVDVGLGDGPLAPIPLIPGTYEQGHLTYTLECATPDSSSFRLINDPTGGFRYMTWADAPVSIDRFAAHHRFLSTSAESDFRAVPTIYRRDADGARFLRGRTFRRIGADPALRLLADRDELLAVLLGEFGLDPAALDPDSLDRIWSSCVESHRAWELAEAARAAQGAGV